MNPRVLASELSAQVDTIIVERTISAWRQPQRYRLVSRCGGTGMPRSYTPLGFPRRFIGSLGARLETRLWTRELRATAGKHFLSVWYDRPDQYVRVKQVGEDVSVYFAHCDYKVDILGNALPGAEENEQKMLEAVDVVFAASEGLAASFREKNRNVYLLPSGYDSRLFDFGRRISAPQVTRRPAPRIGVAGYVSGRIDFEALYEVARLRPDWNLFIVGAMSPDLTWQLASQGRDPDLWRLLTALPNVTYAGEVPASSVPALVDTFDVALAPYVLSAFTMTSSPIKAYEYLALGRPVVSTRIPDLERLGGAIRFVSRRTEWEDAIEESLPSAWDESAICARRRAVEGQSNADRARYALEVIRTNANTRTRASRSLRER